MLVELLFVAALVQSAVGAQSQRVTATDGKDTAVATIFAEPFDARDHEIKLGKNDRYTVDGREAWGILSLSKKPTLRCTGMTVTWNQKTIKVPASLVTDCFDPHLNLIIEGMSYFSAKFDKNHKLLIGMMASDSKAGYVALWTVTKKGEVTRQTGGRSLFGKYTKEFWHHKR